MSNSELYYSQTEEFLTPDDFQEGDVTSKDLLEINGHPRGDSEKGVVNNPDEKKEGVIKAQIKVKPRQPKIRRSYID